MKYVKKVAHPITISRLRRQLVIFYVELRLQYKCQLLQKMPRKQKNLFALFLLANQNEYIFGKNRKKPKMFIPPNISIQAL